MGRLIVLTIALLQLVASAQAHDVVFRDLGGRTLCLDQRSVQVRVDDPDYAQAALYARAVADTLARALRTSLDGFDIPYRERGRCGALFVRLGFTLQLRVDARDRPYHWVLAELQVGRATDQTDGADGAEGDLADQRFAGLAADAIYPPGSVATAGRHGASAGGGSRDPALGPPAPEGDPVEWGMSDDTLFAKIVRGEIPADIVYRDDLVTAFRDIAPRAPTHILIVPNRAIATTDDVAPDDEAALGRLFSAARVIAAQEGLDRGYRLIVNCKEHGGQEVYHLHMHLVGGRPLGPMLSG
jgi:histidine triad (HIT) family protein